MREDLVINQMWDKIRNLENELLLIRDGSLLSKAKNNIIFSADKGIKTLVGARAYLSANQLDIPDTTNTKVLLDTESYDLGGDFGSYRFVASVSGYYQVNGNLYWTSIVADKSYYTLIFVNGQVRVLARAHSSTGVGISSCCSDVLYLAKGDYVELYAYHTAGVNTVDILGGLSHYSYMSVFLISVA